ncbi:MAG: hypothetical protein J6T10_11515 [Methanobrevibacter sp.]|nr:hypothetical protein [Methanobrevibacter sp.]
MKRKLLNSQLSNMSTYLKYKRELIALAQNVFNYENMPEFIDISYLNRTLLVKGAIAFFKDEVLGVLALPFINSGKLDLYGRPTTIQVYGQNGYTKRLDVGEYVIMYDNDGRYPLYIDLLQSIERIANIKRIIDVNLSQQKTPRIWKTSTESEKTVKDLLNSYDGDVESVVAYKSAVLDDLESVVAPAPFVADKLNDALDKEYSEYCRLIGIANVEIKKKERLITDEVKQSMGGTIASRFNRFNPRKKAVDEINKKWGLNIEVAYYDGLPTSMKSVIENSEGVDSDVDISDNEKLEQ